MSSKITGLAEGLRQKHFVSRAIEILIGASLLTFGVTGFFQTLYHLGATTLGVYDGPVITVIALGMIVASIKDSLSWRATMLFAVSMAYVFISLKLFLLGSNPVGVLAPLTSGALVAVVLRLEMWVAINDQKED